MNTFYKRNRGINNSKAKSFISLQHYCKLRLTRASCICLHPIKCLISLMGCKHGCLGMRFGMCGSIPTEKRWPQQSLISSSQTNQMIYQTSAFQSNQQHKQVPLVTALFLPFLKHLDTLETTASGEPAHSTPLFLTSDEGKRGKRQTHHITIQTQTLLGRPSIGRPSTFN